MLEGSSRKILAGMATEHQDVVAVLQLLHAALLEDGEPGGMVSDHGPVFISEAYEGVLAALGIAVCHIEQGKLWQNLIEAQFKVPLRLADAAFAQALTLEEAQRRHAAFIETFNTTPHWAHQDRPDGLRTPVAVLGWVRGRRVDPDHLRHALRQLHVERVVTRAGYASVQRFYRCAERGLTRQRVSIWLSEGRLPIAYREALLAQYAARYNRKARWLRSVSDPQLSRTRDASPQREFWELHDEQ